MVYLKQSGIASKIAAHNIELNLDGIEKMHGILKSTTQYDAVHVGMINIAKDHITSPEREMGFTLPHFVPHIVDYDSDADSRSSLRKYLTLNLRILM